MEKFCRFLFIAIIFAVVILAINADPDDAAEDEPVRSTRHFGFIKNILHPKWHPKWYPNYYR